MTHPRSPTPEAPARRPAHAFDLSPRIVFFETTRACDLVCLHCRACAQRSAAPGESTTDLALIDRLTAFPDSLLLVLTGGDPIKGGDLFNLIDHAVGRGLPTAITPSDTPLVTPEAIGRLRVSGIDRLPGDVLTPLGVAVLASFGRESVRMTPRPSVAVITTGAELVPLGRPVAPHQIRDSNGPMLQAAIIQAGLATPLRLHADDRPEAIREALERSADRDLILLTGGVSAGCYDLVPQVLRDFGSQILFHKVRQRPGKPVLLVRKGSLLLFGLPRNSLACYVGFLRHTAVALRSLVGGSPEPASSRGRLTAPIRYRGRRTCFCPAFATKSAASPEWSSAPLAGVRVCSKRGVGCSLGGWNAKPTPAT